MSTSITTPTQSPDAVQPPADLPFVVEFFMVESESMRCMAYRDQEGKWRNALTHDELTADVRILE